MVRGGEAQWGTAPELSLCPAGDGVPRPRSRMSLGLIGKADLQEPRQMARTQAGRKAATVAPARGKPGQVRGLG